MKERKRKREGRRIKKEKERVRECERRLSCHSKSDMKISFVRSNKKTCQTERRKLLKGDQREKKYQNFWKILNLLYYSASKYTTD